MSRAREPRRVLIPVDFSPAATRTARAALRLTGRWSPHVELLHVVDLPAFVAPYPVSERGAPPMTILEYARLRAADALEQLMAELAPDLDLAGRWGLRLTRRIESGHAGQRIVEIAVAEAFDLVALAGHLRRGRLPTGSVTRWVMRHVPCPVLALPAGAA